MSSSLYRSQLDRKRQQRVDAEGRVGTYRGKEADHRSAAARAAQEAMRTSSASTARMRLRESQRREDQANDAAKEAARWQQRAAGFGREEATLSMRLAAEEQREREAQERERKRQWQAAERAAAADAARLRSRLAATEMLVTSRLPAPKPERLRILMLGSSSEGDLRVGREQKRIRTAVESARHRDLVEIDVRPSATASDLLDGITKFRPHVVHFSGHGDDDLVVFEDEIDAPHEGVVVSAEAFAHAVAATDSPPRLIVLNACNTASQAERLVESVAPFAIGMSAAIEDGDAINYAAQFYAALVNGQSVESAHASGKAALEMAGLAGHELPTLACAEGIDPAAAVLVMPPE